MDIVKLFSDLPILETQRVSLRKINLFDTQDVFEYASDQKVSRYLLWDTHKSTITTRKFIINIMQNYLDGKEAPWGIEYKENSKIIGTIGFNYWDVTNKKAEVGYVLSSKYWNAGLMTEILQMIVNFGITELMLNRIEAKCDPLNVASQKVLGKTGFKYEGLLRKYVSANGEYKDIMLFSLIASDLLNKQI